MWMNGMNCEITFNSIVLDTCGRVDRFYYECSKYHCLVECTLIWRVQDFSYPLYLSFFRNLQSVWSSWGKNILQNAFQPIACWLCKCSCFYYTYCVCIEHGLDQWTGEWQYIRERHAANHPIFIGTKQTLIDCCCCYCWWYLEGRQKKQSIIANIAHTNFEGFFIRKKAAINVRIMITFNW